MNTSHTFDPIIHNAAHHQGGALELRKRRLSRALRVIVQNMDWTKRLIYTNMMLENKLKDTCFMLGVADAMDFMAVHKIFQIVVGDWDDESPDRIEVMLAFELIDSMKEKCEGWKRREAGWLNALDGENPTKIVCTAAQKVCHATGPSNTRSWGA